jgi:hypothetical protein
MIRQGLSRYRGAKECVWYNHSPKGLISAEACQGELSHLHLKRSEIHPLNERIEVVHESTAQCQGRVHLDDSKMPGMRAKR